MNKHKNLVRNLSIFLAAVMLSVSMTTAAFAIEKDKTPFLYIGLGGAWKPCYIVDYNNNLWQWGGGDRETFEAEFVMPEVKQITHRTLLTTDGKMYTFKDSPLECLNSAPVMENVNAIDSYMYSWDDTGYYALTENGDLYAWGLDIDLMGYKGKSDTPKKILDNVEDFEIFSYGTGGYAIKNDGTMWSWGRGPLIPEDVFDSTGVSEFGTEFTYQVAPVQVAEGIKKYDFGLAIMDDNSLWIRDEKVADNVVNANFVTTGMGGASVMYLTEDGNLWAQGAAGNLGIEGNTEAEAVVGMWGEKEMIPYIDPAVVMEENVANIYVDGADFYILKDDGTLKTFAITYVPETDFSGKYIRFWKEVSFPEEAAVVTVKPEENIEIPEETESDADENSESTVMGKQEKSNVVPIAVGTAAAAAIAFFCVKKFKK